MALKYWYKISNGNDNWATAANWYNGPGGTGGVTTVPTAADDVILNAASTGNGILTIAATATCQSLNMTGFTGTLAGGSALNITTNNRPPNDNICILAAGYTHTGVVTFGGSYDGSTGIGYLIFSQNGKSFGSLTINNTGSLPFQSDDVLRVTGTLTLTQGSIYGGGGSGSGIIQCGSFSSSSGTFVRDIVANTLVLTGPGNTLVLGAGLNLYFIVENVLITNISASNKNVTFPSDIGFSCNVYYQGGGGLFSMFPGTSNIIDFYIQGTNGGNISFSSGDYGYVEFSAGTNVTWANTSLQRMTFANYSTYAPFGSGIRVLSNSLPAATGTPPFTFPNLGLGVKHIMDLNGYVLTGGWTIDNISGVRLISNSGTTGSITVTNDGAIYIAANTTTYGAFNLTFGNIYFEDNVSVFTIDGTLTFIDGKIDIAPGSSVTTVNMAIYDFVGGTTSGTRTIGSNPATIFNFNIFGIATCWTVNITYLTITGIINLTATDTSNSDITFVLGGTTYNNITFNRGASTGFCGINTTNIILNLTDLGTAAHGLKFGAGTANQIGKFNVRGTPGNLVTITCTNTSDFVIAKINDGTIVSSDYLNIQHCDATPSNTWYAGTHSIDNQAVATAGSGWIFADPPGGGKKSLALLGVG